MFFIVCLPNVVFQPFALALREWQPTQKTMAAMTAEEITQEFQDELNRDLPFLHLANLPFIWFHFIFIYMTREHVREMLTIINNNLEQDVQENEGKLPPICPKLEDIWNWAKLIVPDNIKVVILGIDPYFSYLKRSNGEIILASNGCGFSMNSEYFVARHRKAWLTFTWQSITRMIYSKPFDLFQRKYLDHGDGNLNSWYEQGVCMFDYYLTTRGKSEAHADFGWDTLTRLIVKRLAEGKERQRVFMFWGSILRTDPILNAEKHFVIYRCHPGACRISKNELCCGRNCWNDPKKNCFDDADSYIAEFSDDEIIWDPLQEINEEA